MCRNYIALDAWQFVFSVAIQRCKRTTNTSKNKSVAMHTLSHVFVVLEDNANGWLQMATTKILLRTECKWLR